MDLGHFPDIQQLVLPLEHTFTSTSPALAPDCFHFHPFSLNIRIITFKYSSLTITFTIHCFHSWGGNPRGEGSSVIQQPIDEVIYPADMGCSCKKNWGTFPWYTSAGLSYPSYSHLGRPMNDLPVLMVFFRIHMAG